MMIIEREKDWELFCFNCVLRDAEVGGDLPFAAQITASTNSYCTVYVAQLVLNSYCMVYVAYPSTFVRFRQDPGNSCIHQMYKKTMMIMEMEKDWAHLGRNPETYVYTKCVKKR
jgi:hypothetical protein